MATKEAARAIREGDFEKAKEIALKVINTASNQQEALKGRLMLALIERVEREGLEGKEAARAFENSIKTVFTLMNMLYHVNRMRLEHAEKLRERTIKALRKSGGLVPEELEALLEEHRKSVEKVRQKIQELREEHRRRREIERAMLKSILEHFKL